MAVDHHHPAVLHVPRTHHKVLVRVQIPESLNLDDARGGVSWIEGAEEIHTTARIRPMPFEDGEPAEVRRERQPRLGQGLSDRWVSRRGSMEKVEHLRGSLSYVGRVPCNPTQGG
jgi:hypothetical protein